MGVILETRPLPVAGEAIDTRGQPTDTFLDQYHF